MRRTLLCTATFLGCILIASAGASPSSSAAPQVVVGKSLDLAPQSRAEGDQAIDDATAAALIGAISGEFGEHSVQVKLDTVEVLPAGIIQRDLHGAGRVMIGSDGSWIPFQFTALYDTEKASVGYPDLVLGGAPTARTANADAAMTRKLAAEVDRRLHQEFAHQSPRIALDTVHVTPAGGRYLRLQANGTATFGREGSTGAGVRALYDARSGHWVQVSYDLGDTAGHPVPGSAVAIR